MEHLMSWTGCQWKSLLLRQYLPKQESQTSHLIYIVISRSDLLLRKQDGDEAVVATKLTGDPNVPAGQTSFKAKITRSNKLSTRDAYPAELGVLARYRGSGRIAKAGNKEAR